MAEEFAGVQVYTGQDLKPISGVAQAQTGAIATDQARAIAEIQAAITLARMNPRKINEIMAKIRAACSRQSLAESSQYAYKRGTEVVSGPSIRLAEVLAKAYTNVWYGLREVSRNPGVSEVEAYAWDLESNVKVIRSFPVKHIRETKSGSYAIKSERDIYELAANMGQRRVRACILEIVDADIVEEAQRICDETLKKTLGEGTIGKMFEAFKEFGVTEQDIEGYLGHKKEAIIDAEIIRLKKVYRSLKDGMAKKEDFFPPVKPVENPPTIKPTTKVNISEPAATATAAPPADGTSSGPEAAPDAGSTTAQENGQGSGDGKSEEDAGITIEKAREIMAELNNHGITVKAFRAKFKVNNIKDLKASQLDEYKVWLSSEVDRQNAEK